MGTHSTEPSPDTKSLWFEPRRGHPPIHRYWWCSLLACPADPNSWAYRRLRRVWHDHTWKGWPFMNPRHENHLSATLFENLSLFRPENWVAQLATIADCSHEIGQVTEAQWGYEIESQSRLADVAINFRDEHGDGVIVIESKRRGGTLKPTDVDPGSYLDLPAFQFTDRRWLIYLLDESDLNRVRRSVDDPQDRHGFLSWQDLGAFQIQLALQHLPDSLRSFVAGAIQYQFAQHDIRPTQLAAEYLADEPACEIITSDNADKQTSTERANQLWRLNS